MTYKYCKSNLSKAYNFIITFYLLCLTKEYGNYLPSYTIKKLKISILNTITHHISNKQLTRGPKGPISLT